MLDVGFSELLLIAIVAIVFIGPEDVPVVLRHAMKFWREVRALSHGLRMQVQQVMDEAGLDDITRGTIIDLEGKPQKAYDVEALKKLDAPKPPAGQP